MSCDNKRPCPCTYPCPHHGKCCECIAYHNRMGEFVACQFSKEAEATYDRSLRKIIQDRK